VTFLRNRSDIDRSHIGLWGGSEGAVIAPWVASRSADVAFVIMQSATGVTFAEQNLHQTTLQMRELGLPQHEIEEALQFQRLKHHYARTGEEWERYATALRASRREPWASLGGPERANDWWWAWYRTKMDIDPTTFLKQVRIPVFALWGGNDRLVPVERSRAAVAGALVRGGNRNATLIVVPGADHSLNRPWGPNPDPASLEAMLDWASDQVRPAAEH
jgi:pimeloyl-ACP methyl ester carboxylesterase